MRFRTSIISGLVLACGWVVPASAQSANDDLNVGLTLELPTTLEMNLAGDITIDQAFGDIGTQGSVEGCLSGLQSSTVDVSVKGNNEPPNTAGFYLRSADDIYIRYFITFSALGNDQSFWNFAFSNGSTKQTTLLDAVTTDETDACGKDLTLNLQAVAYETNHPNASREPQAGDHVFEGYGPATETLLSGGQHTFSDTFTITLSPALTG